jgi:hypothetical protein
MKHFLSVVILIVAVFLLPLAPMDVAYAEEDGYSLVMPSAGNYLYLTSPRTVAVDGNTVAVYDFDNGVHRIYIAGTSVESFTVSLDDPEEYITQLAFLDDKLYVITCFSKLFSYDLASGALTQLSIGCTATAIYPANDALYIYGGYNVIYKYSPFDLSLTAYSDAKYKLIGTKQFVVADGVAYCLKWNGELFSFDLTTLTASVKCAETPINTVCLIENDGKKLLAYVEDDVPTLMLINLDGTVASSIAVSDVTPETAAYISIASDGDTLAALDAGAKSVLLLNDNLNIVDIFGCTSSREGMFDTPSALVSATVANLNATLALDSGNKRVVYASYNEDGSINHTRYLPYGFNAINCISYFDGQIYLSDGKNIFYSDSDFNKPFVVNTNFDVVSFTVCEDGLYVLDSATDSVYRAPVSNKSAFTRFARVSSSSKIIKTAAAIGSPLYCMDDASVSLYTLTGKLSASVTFDQIISPSDFTVDYVGNVFVSTEKSITKYERTLGEFTKGETYTLDGSSKALHSISAFSFNSALGGKNAYAIDSERHVLVSIEKDVGYVNRTMFTATATPKLSNIVSADVSFAKATNCNLYKYQNNYNLITDSVLSGEILLVFNTGDSDLVYVMTEKNAYGFVPSSALSALTPVKNEVFVRSLHDSANVYTFPSTDDSTIDIVGKDVTMTVVDNACDFNNGFRWLKVSYVKNGSEHLGYVMRTRVSEYIVSSPPTNPVYGKAQSARIGAKVNIYSMQDTNSAIITSITDGDKVMLLSDYDENTRFTLVKTDDFVGYILTAELNMDKGLTNGQIIAIVLTGLTIGITAVYFFIVKRNRKQNSKI